MLIGRTVLSEVARNFFASLTATTGLAFFMLSISFLKRTPGVGMGFLVEVFPLFFPLALQFTVPLAVLTAVILTFGRMQGDGELTALSACGVSPGTVMRPVLAAAALVALAALFLTDLSAPFAAARLRAAERDILPQITTAMRAGKRDLDLGRARLSFERFDGRNFTDLCVEWRERRGEVRLGRARHGAITLTPDGRILLDLQDARGVFPQATKHGDVFLSGRDLALEFTIAELVGRRAYNRKRGGLEAWELAYVGGRGIEEGRIRSVEAKEELARRTALAASAFFFALIGIPLGVISARGGRVAAFLMAIAPVLFVYFPLVIAGSNLARDGKLPAHPALWLGNVLLAVVGWLLIRRMVRR